MCSRERALEPAEKVLRTSIEILEMLSESQEEDEEVLKNTKAVIEYITEASKGV